MSAFVQLVHGEQYLELHKPLAPEGATLLSTASVVDVLDKQSGALVVCNGQQTFFTTDSKITSFV